MSSSNNTVAFVEAGRVIRDNADAIVRQWVEYVDAVPDLPSEHRADLRDGLPLLLTRMGEDLISGGDIPSSKSEDAAQRHGRQRWKLGWKLEDVVRDYQTLRPIVEQFLEAKLEKKLSANVMTKVAVLIDEAIIDSIASYTEFHDSLESNSHRTAAEFAAIISSSTDAIISMSVNGDIQSWNRAAETIYGYSADEVLGEHISIIFPKDESSQLDHMLATLASGRSIKSTDMERVTKGGQRIEVAASASPISNRSGAVIGCATIEHDVSRRVRAAEALRHALEEAESANRMKTEFLANVSHELRSPMNAIVGMNALTLEEDLSPVVRDNLLTAQEAAKQLMHLVNDLLDISKLESGKFELEEGPFSLRKTLEETMRLASIKAYQKGLEIAFHIDQDVPDGLSGDALRLQQVLNNLVNNAVKFTDQGEVVVNVGLERSDPSSCKIRFSVSDTGIGISPADRQRIFTPFTQADSSSTRQFGGTGLGLSIASHLVACLGGELVVESTPGKGSTFSFGAHFQRTGEDEEPGSATATVEHLKGVSVLVVDDNETNCEIVKELLRNWGMRSVSVESAESALTALKKAEQRDDPFELVLVDALMPETDGFVLSEEILKRADVPPAIVMMISPSDRIALRERCEAAPADAFLEKPVSQSGLFNTIVSTTTASRLSEDHEGTLTELPQAKASLHVIVVEDTAANRMVVQRVLEKRGHSVTIANNGREALQLVREQQFHVILMDVQMPIMDGFQATAAIRELEQAKELIPAPIIAMTAHAMRGDRDRCLAAGMTDYIAKPIDIVALAEIVERYGQAFAAASSLYPSPPNDEPRNTTPAAGVPGAEASADEEWADLQAALQRLRGERSLLQELIDCFLEDRAPLLAELEEAIELGDFESARRTAHTLKGLALNFSARRTPELAAEMEQVLKDKDTENAQRLLPALVQASQALAQQLETNSL